MITSIEFEFAPHEHAFRQSVQLGASDHLLHVAWRAVPGATGVRISRASLQVSPATEGNGRDLGVVQGARTRQRFIEVLSPEPDTRTRSLIIPNFVCHRGADDIRIRGTSMIKDHRLVVRPVSGGHAQAPVVAVPPLHAVGMRPQLLTGAFLSGSRLLLPDLPGGHFQISVVTGETPEEFVAQEISFGDVRAYAAPGPVGLHVIGPEGDELYALAGPMTGPATVDVRASLERYLGAHPAEPVGDLALRADREGIAGVTFSVDGVIERRVRGRLEATVEGSVTDLVLPPPDPVHRPARTFATLTLTHMGLALHPISDAVPDDGAPGGPIVRDSAVVRELPPRALAGLDLRRVAVVGLPLTQCDLTLEVLGHTATRRSLPADPGPTGPQVVWFDLGEDVPVDGPVRVSLTATRGAFGWVSRPEPLVRFAVTMDPTGQNIRVGNLALRLTGRETVVAAELAGPPPWQVATDQFCTVALAEVVLEFQP